MLLLLLLLVVVVPVTVVMMIMMIVHCERLHVNNKAPNKWNGRKVLRSCCGRLLCKHCLLRETIGAGARRKRRPRREPTCARRATGSPCKRRPAPPGVSARNSIRALGLHCIAETKSFQLDDQWLRTRAHYQFTPGAQIGARVERLGERCSQKSPIHLSAVGADERAPSQQSGAERMNAQLAQYLN